ncbi:oligosaccharyltransferase complex, partial [Striga asiatica]
MANNRSLSAAALLLILLPSLLSPPVSAASPIVSELSDLQSRSPSGLHSKPDLQLPTLKSEFALVSSAFLSNNPAQKTLIFFFEIDFDESQASFALFDVNSLPHVRLLSPFAADPKSDSLAMDASDFSRLAESMADFISSRTNLPVGPIGRPPIISKTQILIVIAAILIWTPFFIKKLISGNTIFHEKSTWMAGAIFVYFFSVSGTMFNVIRKMPLFLVDRNNPDKLVFFYKGSGMQLGAEGFAVGFLYTVVGLLLAFVVHGLVLVKNRAVQRLLTILALFVSVWAVREVVFLDHWKTGYGVRFYWPSRTTTEDGDRTPEIEKPRLHVCK